MDRILELQKIANKNEKSGLTSNLSFACAVVSTISFFKCTGNPGK